MKNKFVNNAGWLIGGKIFQMIIGFLVNIYMARYLGPSNYGDLTYTLSFVTFMTSFCNLGINDIIVKELVNNRDIENEYLGTSICLRLVSSLLSLIILLLLVKLSTNNDNLIILTFIQGISLIFQSFDLISYWFQSHLNAKYSTIIATISYLIVTIYKIYLLINNKNIYYFAFIVTLESFLLMIFLIIGYNRSSNKKLKFNRNLIKVIMSQSYHFMLSGIMIVMYSQMDKIMIGELLNNIEVGYYGIALGIGSMWVFLISSIINSASPIILQKKNSDNLMYIKYIKRLYCSVFWVSIVISIFIACFASPIIYILYGNSYSGSIEILRVATWIVGISYLGVASNIWYIAENKQKYIKYILLISVVLNLLLNYILISIYGATGAALATLCTQIFVVFIAPLIFKDIRVNTKNLIEAIFFIKVF